MDTFLSLLLEQADRQPQAPAIRSKRLGIWVELTWAQLRDRVSVMAQALSRRGVGSGTHLGVFGPNRDDMYVTYLAAHSLGAVVVPISTSTYGIDLKTLVEGADVELVMSVEQQHVDALLECGQGRVREIYYSNPRGMDGYQHSEMVLLDTILEGIEPSTDYLQDLQTQLQADQCAAIVSTSGSSPNSCLVELSQEGLIATARGIVECKSITPKDNVMAYLPLSSVGDLTFAYALTMTSGCCMNCPESEETVLENMQEIGPTVMYGPAYVYKYIFTHASNRIESAEAVDTQIYKWAYQAVMNEVRYHIDDKPAPFLVRLLAGLARITTFNPFRNVYGLSNIRLALCGSQVIAPTVFHFFRAIGIDLRETYGLTESNACLTVQMGEDWNSESVGQPLPNTELRVDENSEIWFRSAGRMKGIYKNPEETARRVTEDGWVRTSDVGHIDAEGRLHVQGKIHRRGALTNGSAFQPEVVESKLRSSPFIKYAIAFGDSRDSVAAIISVDGVITQTWADRRNLRYTGYADLTAHAEVQDLIRAQMHEVNALLAEDEQTRGMQVRRFAILNREFRERTGEISMSRKLRWATIAEQQRELIDALYSEATEYTYEDAVDNRSYTIRLENV